MINGSRLAIANLGLCSLGFGFGVDVWVWISSLVCPVDCRYVVWIDGGVRFGMAWCMGGEMVGMMVCEGVMEEAGWRGIGESGVMEAAVRNLLGTKTKLNSRLGSFMVQDEG